MDSSPRPTRRRRRSQSPPLPSVSRRCCGLLPVVVPSARNRRPRPRVRTDLDLDSASPPSPLFPSPDLVDVPSTSPDSSVDCRLDSTLPSYVLSPLAGTGPSPASLRRRRGLSEVAVEPSSRRRLGLGDVSPAPLDASSGSRPLLLSPTRDEPRRRLAQQVETLLQNFVEGDMLISVAVRCTDLWGLQPEVSRRATTTGDRKDVAAVDTNFLASYPKLSKPFMYG